ncbi:nucleotidyltransferase family protein [Thioflexithrix psekupsensis]|nr:nucleotidyltransferase family protein [Thioflexithrix psekupsensis]
MNTETILTQLKQFKQQYAQQYHLKSLGIFGSHARHQATSSSDIDIFFETDTPNLLTTARLQQELTELLHCRVDLIRLRPSMNPKLKAHIISEAIYV